MKYRKILALSFAIAMGVTNLARAHETVNNGSATMFVHIDPIEPPVAGMPATVYLNLTNTQKGFSVDSCNCTLTIGQKDKVIKTANLVATSDSTAFGIVGVPLTFPSVGKYDITVSGAPKTPGAFTSFTTDYDTEVVAAGSAPTTHNSPIYDMAMDQTTGMHMQGMMPWQHVAHLTLMFGAVAASIVVIIRERKELFKKKPLKTK